MRVAALEEWAEVELALGHHNRLVPELVRLVLEHPLREELRCLHMLALYRCGRQAEAHATYRDAHAFLIEEFGVEPGQGLQRLHQRMLQNDPALEWRERTALAAVVTGPELQPPPVAAPQPHGNAAWAPPVPYATSAPSGVLRWVARVLVVALPLVRSAPRGCRRR